MVEIYNISISEHERYARDQQTVEQFTQQYHLPPSGDRFIAGQTTILNLVPKHPAVVVLMQTYQRISWARFRVPTNFLTQRLFNSPYLAPSLGPSEKQDADMKRVHALIEHDAQQQGSNPEKEHEGVVLIRLLQEVQRTNEMVDYVIGRMKQFVQG